MYNSTLYKDDPGKTKRGREDHFTVREDVRQSFDIYQTREISSFCPIVSRYLKMLAMNSHWEGHGIFQYILNINSRCKASLEQSQFEDEPKAPPDVLARFSGSHDPLSIRLQDKLFEFFSSPHATVNTINARLYFDRFCLSTCKKFQ